MVDRAIEIVNSRLHLSYQPLREIICWLIREGKGEKVGRMVDTLMGLSRGKVRTSFHRIGEALAKSLIPRHGFYSRK